MAKGPEKNIKNKALHTKLLNRKKAKVQEEKKEKNLRFFLAPEVPCEKYPDPSYPHLRRTVLPRFLPPPTKLFDVPAFITWTAIFASLFLRPDLRLR